MLQHLPFGLGKMFRKVRPGIEKTVYYDPMFKDVPQLIQVTSSEFSEGQMIPVVFTADGQKISPPLQWKGIPPNAQSIVLMIEDADSPTPEPLTHAMILDLLPQDSELSQGQIKGYLAPDPPPGHGIHHYVFQIFALDGILHLPSGSFKKTVKKAMYGRLLAKGHLTGTYERRKL